MLFCHFQKAHKIEPTAVVGKEKQTYNYFFPDNFATSITLHNWSDEFLNFRVTFM